MEVLPERVCLGTLQSLLRDRFGYACMHAIMDSIAEEVL